MPRLTFVSYCERYRLLRKTWEKSPGIFIYLRPNDQWALFDYFAFHKERSEEELKAQWASLRIQSSSLPQRAGQAYKQFTGTLAHMPGRLAPAAPIKDRRASEVKVYGQVQPKIEVDSLVQVVMMLARQLQAESRPNR